MGKYSIGVEVSHGLAAGEAYHSNHEFIIPDHLFCGLTKLQDVVRPEVLPQLRLPGHIIPRFRAEVEHLLRLFQEKQLDPRKARHRLRELLGSGNYARESREHISRSDESQAVFARASEIAEEVESPWSLVQHLLAALLELEKGHIRQVLAEMDVDADALHEAAVELPAAHTSSSPTPFLDEHGQDLVELARRGGLTEVIGRKDEMLQIIRTLGRDTKNNPVLIGEAGVGKTAIVEGIAYRIAQGNIPPDFHQKRIVQINPSDLVAGTKYRGEFEERMRFIVAEASEADDVVLFIDELHLLIGAGSSHGPMDAANILKPALARGFRLIGATTMADYRRYIEADKALVRRLRPIRVEEPDQEATRRILHSVRERLQNKHNVSILDEAIETALLFSVRYMPERRLPDKAIDLLMDACSRVQYPMISFHPDQEQPLVRDTVVSSDTVREVVADHTGIPVVQLGENERQRVLKMEDFLRERIVGQDQAIEVVAAAVKRSFVKIRREKRPVGVFLFVGPTGVGKTALAKAVAQFLFGSEERIIRRDMSEYGAEHNLARLIGAPPGYIGYEKGGQLTEALRETPYAVVLLDEIERAHPEVLDVFLQLFEEGRLTDGQGRTIDASHALFIMTSNLGFSARQPDSLPLPQGGTQTGHSERETIEHAVYSRFQPEFINRVDDIVFFERLQPEAMPAIVRIQLRHLVQSLADKDIGLKVSDEAIRWLSDRAYDPQFGARPLVRLINKELMNEIGGLILADRLKPTHTVHVSLDSSEDALQFNILGSETL